MMTDTIGTDLSITWIRTRHQNYTWPFCGAYKFDTRGLRIRIRNSDGSKTFVKAGSPRVGWSATAIHHSWARARNEPLFEFTVDALATVLHPSSTSYILSRNFINVSRTCILYIAFKCTMWSMSLLNVFDLEYIHVVLSYSYFSWRIPSVHVWVIVVALLFLFSRVSLKKIPWKPRWNDYQIVGVRIFE